MENILRYKQFDLIVKVELENSSSTGYEIITTARQIDITQRQRTCLIFKEFDSEKAAYEYGLQDGRAWIDTQTGGMTEIHHAR